MGALQSSAGWRWPLFRIFLHCGGEHRLREQLLTLQISPAGSRYRLDSDYISFTKPVCSAQCEVPGVFSAGTILRCPSIRADPGYRIEGLRRSPSTNGPCHFQRQFRLFPHAEHSEVQGRPFTERDTETAPLVIIIIKPWQTRRSCENLRRDSSRIPMPGKSGVVAIFGVVSA